MAVRRGVAVGGDRDLLPAAARRARRARRAASRSRSRRCWATSSRRPARSSAARRSCARSGPSRTGCDIAAARDPAEAAALEHSAARYARAAAALGARRPAGAAGGARELDLGGDARGAAAARDATRGVRLQLATGIAAHRARSGGWRGGLWLPECAHAPWLDALLEEAGVRAACVDLTDVLGRGAPRSCGRCARRPARCWSPLDRAVLELVWSDAGLSRRAARTATRIA